jgi:uncharacterized protein YydD (DUF2326 family)
MIRVKESTTSRYFVSIGPYCWVDTIILSGFWCTTALLIDGVDERQVATLFRLADKVSKENQVQYIISANRGQLNSLMDGGGLTEEEFQFIIQARTVLNLSDGEPEGKLLGI